MPPRINIPPLTRSLFISLIALTFLNATLQPDWTPLSPFTRTGNGSPYLTIVPGISIRYPWTIGTAALVEQNIFGLLVTGLTLYFGGRYLERAYGGAEYAKYILCVALMPNLLCFAFYVTLYAMSGSEKALYVH
jgi:membrane associated rhomboid family serine protease